MTKESTTRYQTKYVAGQDNIQPLGLDIHYPVFIGSAIGTSLLVLFALVFQDLANELFGALRPWLTTTFDWVFMASMNIFVIFCVFLVLSPLGGVRIGGDKAKPEFSYIGWFSMLFAAGMGIGLVFFGVLEPVNHVIHPPLDIETPVDGNGNIIVEKLALAKHMGMAATLLHWMLHPWAAYSIVALSLAIFHFNKKLPLTIRSAFYPIFGERIWGWRGHIIDVLAVFATLAGLATSLGYGAEQASAGIGYLLEIEAGQRVKIGVIIAITAIALISITRGLDGGVRVLSQINLFMAVTLMIFVLIAGPTLIILGNIFKGIGAYIVELPGLSNWVGREDTDYFHGWTTMYWAWWIAWAPFVGMFIARISKGRTIREFILCVVLIPSLASAIWMTVFGSTALDQFITDGYTGVTETIRNWAPELALFKMLDQLAFTQVTSVLGIILVLVFFMTSLDSGSLVVDTITSGGKTQAPVAQRILWCCFEALIAIALMLGGGLGALQAFAIAMGFPFCIILVCMVFSLWKGLRSEQLSD